MAKYFSNYSHIRIDMPLNDVLAVREKLDKMKIMYIATDDYTFIPIDKRNIYTLEEILKMKIGDNFKSVVIECITP